MSDAASLPLNDQLRLGPVEVTRRSNLSQKLCRMSHDGGIAWIALSSLQQWGLDEPLPRPIEQLNELILHIGNQIPSHSHMVLEDDLFISAWIGCANTPDDPLIGLKWLLQQETVERLIVVQPHASRRAYRLTWEGWLRYEELKREVSTSDTAFMAMQFGDSELTQVVDQYFRPAVAATGFTLNLLTDNQGAGCIDDQLRVAIRLSRFLLADLSHNNRGAYWEAGFAEGLGKPVIYTCKKSVWDSEPVHFDTSHLVTIIWDPADLDDAAKRLKATIRATLPEVAKMTD